MLDFINSIISYLPGETTGTYAGAAVGGGLSVWQRLKRALGERKSEPADNAWQGRTAPAATSNKRIFSVLIAHLEGDDEGAQAARVMEVLRSHFPEGGAGPVLRLKQLPKVLSDAPDDPAWKRGRKWLRKENADLLIWGNLFAAEKLLHVHVLPSEDHEGSGRPYVPNDVFALPENFSADLGGVLALAVVALLQPELDRAGYPLTPLIGRAVEQLAPLATNLGSTFPEESKATLWHAYATGEYQLGAENCDNVRLETAIEFYRKALVERTRERDAYQWAAAQGNLGNALQAVGARSCGSSRLEQAIAAYHEALQEFTRENAPLHWSATMANLGDALTALGERKSGTTRLEEAITVYSQALHTQPRETMPVTWAETRNKLGRALAILGGRERGTERLEQAIAIFGEAQQQAPRERVPMLWAAALANMGDALLMLGEHDDNNDRLEQAVATIREALTACTRERAPFQWLEMRARLGHALVRLGRREAGTERLDEAAGIIHETLSEVPRDCAPLLWAMLQNHLGEQLQAIAERQLEGSRELALATLKEARAAFVPALGEFVSGDATHFEAMTRGNLGRLIV